MRSPFFLLFASLLFVTGFTLSAQAQSAVYYCPETGALGYAYGNKENGNKLRKIRKAAEEACINHAGYNCTLIFETDQPGWGGLIRGVDVFGVPLAVAAGGYATKDQLMFELKNKYFEKTGEENEQTLTLTWKAEQ